MNPDQSFSPVVATELRELLTNALSSFLPTSLVDPVVNVTIWLVVAVVVLVVVLFSMLYATWLERKIVGRIQDRYGANRVGPFGLLQPFADMIKILIKEDVTPTQAHRWVYNLGSMLIVPPALIVFSVVPVGMGLIPADLSVGVLFFMAVGATAVIPIFMAGWGSRNKYTVIGSMRAVAQIVSYEIPQVLAIVGVLVLAGTLSMQRVVLSQGPIHVEGVPDFPGVWFVFLQPIAFVIFLIATAAEIERTPFDVPEAESEIIAGYHTEYAGIKFGMFYLAIYFLTIAAAAFGTVMFLGGWQPPISQLSFIPGWIWFFGKALLFILLFMWLRGTLPRLRVDQMMEMCWKVLVPVGLANVFTTALVGKLTYEIDASPAMVFFGFALTNVLLLAVAVWLVSRWRSKRSNQGLRFEEPVVTESAV
jgi:NADH-quinone oxidoreductase subunit H